MFNKKYSNIYCKFYKINKATSITSIYNNLTKYNASFIPLKSDYIQNFIEEFNPSQEKNYLNIQIKKYLTRYYSNIKIQLKKKEQNLIALKNTISKSEQKNINHILEYPFIRMLINPIGKINLSNSQGKLIYNNQVKHISQINKEEILEFMHKCNVLLNFVKCRYELKTIMSFIIYNNWLMLNNNKIIVRVILENKKDKNLVNLLNKKELTEVFNKELFKIFFNKEKGNNTHKYYFQTK